MKAKARNTDPRTSKDAARSFNPKAQAMTMLKVFSKLEYPSVGLTAEGAYRQTLSMRNAYVSPTGYWKRVSDLLAAGYLKATDYVATGSSGREQRCYLITEKGKKALTA